MRTMMSMSSGSSLSGMLMMAILGVSLAGCQHSSSFERESSRDAWRVMERVGDIRMTRNDGFESRSLRPGELVADDGQVTTSGNSLLIISKNGFQLTAGENTSFRLPSAAAAPNLFLERGWLRVRLAKPVDQEVRIKTAEFDINASNATLTLRAEGGGTTLTVDAGSAVLATTDGRHRATLVAGAAAKMDPTSGDDLLIQPASGRGFTKVSPPPASTRSPSSDRNLGALDKTKDKTKPQPAAAPPAESDLIILPASHRKMVHKNHPKPMDAIAKATLPPQPTDLQPSGRHPTKTDTHPPRQGDIIPSSMPEDEPPITGDDERVRRSVYDPLQLQFDSLTEGLVDGL